MAVQSVLEELSIKYHSIELGEVTLAEALDSDEQKKLNSALQHYKLGLLDDKKEIVVERIKTQIIELFHYPDDERLFKLSEYLSRKLDYDYTYLSNIFSEIERSTIERFYIVTRIERVKELIVYEDISITEIAHKMNFSNVSHLCLQFKKVTGLTPSLFRKMCEAEGFVWRICE